MALIGKLVRVVLRCVVFTGTVGALFLPPSSAIGDPGHCVGISLNTTAPIDVYLNYESFEHLYNDKYVQGGITADEAIGMVHQAMEEWNHSSAGRPLVYKGTTTAIRGTCNYAVVRGGPFPEGL